MNSSSFYSLIRCGLSLGEDDDLQRLMSIEPTHGLMKILQRVECRLHDPLDIESGAQERQHPLPRREHPAADDALQRHAFEDDVARVVVDGNGVTCRKPQE